MKPKSYSLRPEPKFALHLVRPQMPFLYGFGLALTVRIRERKGLRTKESDVGGTDSIGVVETTGIPVMKYALRARLIDRSSADFEVICNWRDICKRSHVSKCGEYESKALTPSDMRMIDCERRCVVPWPPRAQYAALSYVWGETQPRNGDRLDYHGFSKELPLTIEDALEVTRRWGLRYVWVDRFCIDFYNESESQAQILQMNLVYQNAELTIIAAAGHDASFGLLGISTRPRVQKPSLRLGNLQLASTLTDPKTHLQASKWIQRG